MNNAPREVTALFCVLLLVFGFVFLAAAVRSSINFLRELKFMKIEIERSGGEEKEYWLCQRKRLWLSLLLFWKR